MAIAVGAMAIFLYMMWKHVIKRGPERLKPHLLKRRSLENSQQSLHMRIENNGDWISIQPKDLLWRVSNLMKIPNADFLERANTMHMGARLWRYQPRSAGTLHKHVSSEEFYFVVEGVGRMRIGNQTLTIQEHGAVFVRPGGLRQIFNDTDQDCLWLIIGAPEEAMSSLNGDMSEIYPVDPKQLPPELNRITRPEK